MARRRQHIALASDRTGSRTAKGLRTRQAFERAGREVITRQGFANATISDIAAAAGRSPGSFYNYFDSTRHLLETLAQDFKDDVFERFSRVQLDDTSLEAVMRELVRAYWTAYRDRSADLAGIFQASMMDDEFAESWRVIRADGRNAIAASISWAQDLGYCPGLDPSMTASALGAMMDYFCYVWLVGGGELGEPECDEQVAIETLTQIWLRAVVWQDAADPADDNGHGHDNDNEDNDRSPRGKRRT